MKKDNELYVYYNDKMEIICISGSEDKSIGERPYAFFHITEMKDFLDGKKRTTDYFLKPDNLIPNKFIIQKKNLQEHETFFVDAVIEYNKNDKDSEFSIYIDTVNKNIKLSCTKKHEPSENITDNKKISFYLCKPGNPYHLYESFVVPVKKLISGEIIEYKYITNKEFGLFSKNLFETHNIIKV